MHPRAWVAELTFSDGSTITLDRSDVVVVVGPNNSGKSAALRAVRDKIASELQSPVVTDLYLEREGSGADVVAWLDAHTRKREPLAADAIYEAYGVTVHASQVEYYWTKPGPVLAQLARLFCHLLTADERLQAANPAPNIAVVRQPPTHPIHYLVRDDQLELRLSKQFRKAFGTDLVVNRVAGSEVPLHVGERPVPAQGQDRLSLKYVQALEQLPMLHTQGDGMRSFVGVLLHTSVGRESILLIDEPEAFLHPPQARQLGRMLVTDKPNERQLFVATHSGDVLRGVLDVGSDKVRVIRIRREGAVNHVRELDNAKIAELWSDPLLRSSNILDGLFHEKVVVCEADSDARFYAAVTDAITNAASEDSRRPDIMFTHCGGKDRVATVVRALKRVDVPIVAVLDFDILSAEHPLHAVVDAAGGDWLTVQKDWNIVHKAIASKKAELSSAEVKAAIDAVLSSVTGSAFPSTAADEIRKVFRRSSPWATAKAVGKAFIPAGDATKAYDRLTLALRQLGIAIVDVGELESFVKSVGNHGPRWVNEVLKKDLLNDPELATAREFVDAVVATT